MSIINSLASLGHKDPDVNSQGQVDEDGDYTSDPAPSPNTSVNEVSGGEPDEEDDSPAVFSATVTHNGKVTLIDMEVASPTGTVHKHHALPGHLTAKRLADAIMHVASW